MRLKNPGSVDKALAAVKKVKGELWNASAADTSMDKKTAILNGCNNWAIPQLGNHFPATEELLVLITEPGVVLPVLAVGEAEPVLADAGVGLYPPPFVGTLVQTIALPAEEETA